MRVPRRQFKRSFPGLKIKASEREECNSLKIYCECGCVIQYKRFHSLPHSDTRLQNEQEWCGCGLARNKEGKWGYYRVCNEHLS